MTSKEAVERLNITRERLRQLVVQGIVRKEKHNTYNNEDIEQRAKVMENYGHEYKETDEVILKFKELYEIYTRKEIVWKLNELNYLTCRGEEWTYASLSAIIYRFIPDAKKQYRKSNKKPLYNETRYTKELCTLISGYASDGMSIYQITHKLTKDGVLSATSQRKVVWNPKTVKRILEHNRKVNNVQ